MEPSMKNTSMAFNHHLSSEFFLFEESSCYSAPCPLLPPSFLILCFGEICHFLELMAEYWGMRFCFFLDQGPYGSLEE
jgi:hypothetical protein